MQTKLKIQHDYLVAFVRSFTLKAAVIEPFYTENRNSGPLLGRWPKVKNEVFC